MDETINDNPFSSFAKIIQSPTILAFNEIPTNEGEIIGIESSELTNVRISS